MIRTTATAIVAAALLAACQPAPPPAPAAPPATSEEGRIVPAPGVDVTAPSGTQTRTRAAGRAAGVVSVGAPGSLDGSPESCAAAHGVTVTSGIPEGTPSNLASYQACVAARTP